MVGTSSSTEQTTSPPTTEDLVTTTTMDLVAATSGAENCDSSSTIDEVFACWQRNRQRVVDRLTVGIEAGDWGVDVDGVLRGPGGLVADLSRCPDDWSDTAGVDADTIRLAQTSPLSGGISESSYFPGVQAYLNIINGSGGIGGRQVALSVHDDSFVPSATVEIVTELLADDEILAIHTAGVVNTLAVAPLLDEACVPLPFAQAAHPALTDSGQFLWLTGAQLSFASEVELWFSWLEQQHADRLPLSAAAIVMEGFGSFYETAFRDAIKRRPGIVDDFNAVWHDPAEPDIRPLLTTVAEFDPDVYIQMTAGHPCLMALEGAKEHGVVGNINRTDRIFLTSSFCTQPNSYLIPAGDAGSGALAIGRNTANATPHVRLDDGVVGAWVTTELRVAGLDWSQSLPWVGFIDVGWSLVEALRIADSLPGGLSRSNLLLAMHTLDLDHPAHAPGVAYKTEGITDRHLVEGGPMMEYDAETEQWSTLGILDVDDRTPSCAWKPGPYIDSTNNQNGHYGATYFGHCEPDQ